MRIVPLALAAVAPTLLVVTFLIGSTPDDEEFRWGVLSSFLHVRALADGALLSWTAALGLGIPQPMVPNFNMHPLAPLLAVVSPVTWMRLLYAAHTLVGAAGMWRLGGMLPLTPITRAVAVFTFLLATPAQNYALTDHWPSHYVMWTLAPWLLVLAWRLLDATGRDAARLSVLLGLAGGVVLATTHPAHVPVYGTVVIAVAAARHRALLDRWRPMVAASVIALVIAGPNLVQLASERLVFGPELEISKLDEPLRLSAAWDLFLKPLSDPPGVDVVSQGARGVFFGGPFAALALIGLFCLGRRHLDLALGTAISAVLLFTPVLPLEFVSRYHFRDPALLCAIPLAAATADMLLRRPRARAAAGALLLAQCAAVLVAAVPLLRPALTRENRQATAARGATGAVIVADRVLSLMPTPGRVAYAPQVDFEVSERGLLPSGFGVNALAYRGVALVNGSFKGISTDELWPNDRLFYGRIRLPAQLVASDEALDLLGIRYLLARRGEAVAAGLRERASIADVRGTPLVLYENPDAWPGAFLVEAAPTELPELPVYSNCNNDRLLCRDLTPLARLRAPGRVDVTRRDGQIDIAVDSSMNQRLLIVAEMFRPAWTATGAGGPLPIVSVGPGLLGVTLPAGTSTLRLEHRRPLLTSATVLAWLAMAASIAALLLLSRRARSPRTVH